MKAALEEALKELKDFLLSVKEQAYIKDTANKIKLKLIDALSRWIGCFLTTTLCLLKTKVE